MDLLDGISSAYALLVVGLLYKQVFMRVYSRNRAPAPDMFLLYCYFTDLFSEPTRGYDQLCSNERSGLVYVYDPSSYRF